ncbi:hypothetical protein [Hyphomicrobium sp. CS1BSMeth3]|uniref:capsular polysaccharide export protein, LipB/KpsS family n=1 Tax=Hyphomicrobium sp. CS1BSMeth3 TaxID=1892844 RepID=UPI000930D29D|nr:hypothetical protein [Hyphomicrobium sp. CS1BSMeth3]
MGKRESDAGATGDPSAVIDTPIAACLGVPAWNRAAIAAFLCADSGTSPAFCQGTQEAIAIAEASRGAVAVWPSRAPSDFDEVSRARGIPVARIEDGFLRSNGLGVECRTPISIIVDRSGIHFDPSRPSDLEQTLSKRTFDEALLARARRLIAQIVRLDVTKYNLTTGIHAPLPRGERTVLVAGQVEDDLSVRLGGAGVTSNMDLLRRARALEPGACILYKPHPDVETGLRRGYHSDAALCRYANHVVRDLSVPALLRHVDAVHVLTSLIGFEALLRGREVIVHGQPFYSGWGLTQDLAPVPRRQRHLNVVELAAAALILYPRYLDPETGRLCSAETAVDRLVEGTATGGRALPMLRRLQGWALKTWPAGKAA